ncbi:MAG TPA: hypothetical protein VKD28_01700 [Gemmatimonadales bacterium]|nr:hypothetical protein [Gemmatimonadales bacterium]
MPERRYTDKEIAAIFRAATDGPASPPEVPREEGLTLPDLQAIGREVGIAPEAIARAANGLDVTRGLARSFLGLPLGVARTVNLNRRLTDDEWERLVVQLREVFDARGSTRSDGSLRQWTNGNLQVLLEPTESGHRLRFRTMHGGAQASIAMGFVCFGAAAVTTLITALTGSLGEALGGIAFLGAAGSLFVAVGALRLPRWARIRGKQMDALAAQIASPGLEGTEDPSKG